MTETCRESIFLSIYLEGISPSQGPLPVHRTAQTQNKRIQTSMHQLGFERTTPVFERAKTVRALDRAVTAIGMSGF
jgi:hypothetical protein